MYTGRGIMSVCWCMVMDIKSLIKTYNERLSYRNETER